MLKYFTVRKLNYLHILAHFNSLLITLNIITKKK